jgi:hypothetical protein
MPHNRLKISCSLQRLSRREAFSGEFTLAHILSPPRPYRRFWFRCGLGPNTDKVLYGQDAYFVGFPYGLFTGGKKVNGLYPIAFIKKGTFSATVREGIATVIFLDGHNNPGFSGGPIVYRDLNQNGTVFYLAGVISGFLPELIPTVVPEVVKPGQNISQEEPWRIRKLNDGRIFKLKDTEQLAPLNTGIVKGYHIKHAVELIRKNPIGPTVSETFEQ